MRRRRIIIYLPLLLAGLAVLTIALDFQVYEDLECICENTGSRKAYRQWSFGLKTTKWYKKSPLEEFMENKDPNALVHRWRCYSGTVRSIFGGLHWDGVVGAIRLLDAEVLRLWMQNKDDKTIRELYDLLVSNDQEKIQERIMEIINEVLETNQ